MVGNVDLRVKLNAYPIWKWGFLGSVTSLPFLSVALPPIAGLGAGILVPQVAIGITALLAIIGTLVTMATGRAVRIGSASRPFSIGLVLYLLLFFIEIVHSYTGSGLYSIESIATARILSLACLLAGMPVIMFREKDFHLLMRVFFIVGIIASVVNVASAAGYLSVFIRLSNPLPFEIAGTSIDRSLGFLRGSGNNAVVFGFALTAWLYLDSLGNRYEIVKRFGGILIIAGIVVTGSRNVWVTAFIVALLFWIKRRGSSENTGQLARSLKWFVGIVVGAVTLALVAVALYSVRSRSVDLRIEQHQVMLRELSRNVLFGLGPGGIEVKGHLLHNSFLLFAVGGGLVGIVLMLFIGYHFVRIILYEFKSRAVGALGVGCTGFIIAALFYPASSQGNPVFWLGLTLFFVVAGRLDAQRGRKRPRQVDSS